jgi:hypothetical protein
MSRNNSWKDQLWNVSFLPTVKVEPRQEPPQGPEPTLGSALRAPALLSRVDVVATDRAEAA